jgi:hypothetical protein
MDWEAQAAWARLPAETPPIAPPQPPPQLELDGGY